MSLEIKINPIGSIDIEENCFFVSIKSKYRDALRELERFSNIHVVWWGNQSDSPGNRDILLVEKPYKNSPDKLGIFATRSEIRPNPVLISIASIIDIDLDTGRIQIPWIDAEKGSPVIDIKPYLPSSDRIKNVRIPDWCSEWPQWYEDSGTFDWSSVFNF